MKNRQLFASVLFLFTAVTAFSAEKKISLTEEEQNYAELVTTITKAGSPYLKDNHVIFTAVHDARHVGIAFDFENYREIHSFKIKRTYDYQDNETGSFLFYILDLPKNVQEFKYRLVIDGLWTTDPLNDSKVYDESTKLVLSHFDASRYIAPATETLPNGMTRFIYRGKTGQHVRLGGSFTNWDSWIYDMPEVQKGLYQFDLYLPKGEYQYAFFTGILSFPDDTNPVKVYTPEGKTASLLIVK